MRLLLLNQFYPPDPAPTGVYLHDLATALVAQGHEVTVLCSQRDYSGGARYPRFEFTDGVAIRRLPATGFGRRGLLGKLTDYATFCASLVLALATLRPKPDLVLSLTTPPYLGLAARTAAWWHGCRHAHWVMDLYPDVLQAHGMVGKRGALASILQRLTRYQFGGASAVLTLGPVMAEKVSAYCDAPPASHIPGAPEPHPPHGALVRSVPLWAFDNLIGWPEDHPNPLRKERGWSPQEMVLLYSGNMGLGHRLGEFLEAARRLGPTGPRWVFGGGGKRRPDILQFQSTYPEARIELADYVPADRLNEHLCAADVHLASLDAAWQGVMVPSKLQASFAVGRPVIFVGDQNNETARWIQESGGGWVVRENDVEALIEAVQEAGHRPERDRRGALAQAFAKHHFLRNVNCRKIVQVLIGETGPFTAELTACPVLFTHTSPSS